MTARNWLVYIILCSDNSLYTGITTDIARRFRQHAAGKGARYFRGRQPLRVVYLEMEHNRSSAASREAAIKAMTRSEKADLLGTSFTLVSCQMTAITDRSITDTMAIITNKNGSFMLKKVISGGQTGVDRAGLDAALAAGIPIGGYCPKGRLAEDGTIPDKYPLIELESTESYYRTEKNVLQSDGTLIINRGALTQGTRLTQHFCIEYGKPCLIVRLDARAVVSSTDVIRWLSGQLITTLNIAGPRESKYPEGIYADARACLDRLFALMKETA